MRKTMVRGQFSPPSMKLLNFLKVCCLVLSCADYIRAKVWEDQRVMRHHKEEGEGGGYPEIVANKKI